MLSRIQKSVFTFNVFLLLLVNVADLHASTLCNTELKLSRSGKDLYQTKEFAAYQGKNGEIGLQLSELFLQSKEVIRGNADEEGFTWLSGEKLELNGTVNAFVEVVQWKGHWVIIKHEEYIAVIKNKTVSCKEYNSTFSGELQGYLFSLYEKADMKSIALTPARTLAEKLFGNLDNA